MAVVETKIVLTCGEEVFLVTDPTYERITVEVKGNALVVSVRDDRTRTFRSDFYADGVWETAHTGDKTVGGGY